MSFEKARKKVFSRIFSMSGTYPFGKLISKVDTIRKMASRAWKKCEYYSLLFDVVEPWTFANRMPIQFLGPAPKDIKNGAFSKSGFSIQRYGLNSFASSPQYSSIVWSRSTGTSTFVPTIVIISSQPVYKLIYRYPTIFNVSFIIYLFESEYRQ